MRLTSLFGLVVAALLEHGASTVRAAPPVPDALARGDDAEFHEMLAAILVGANIGPGGGWFHPAESRYSWEWLAAMQGVSPKDTVPKERFRGPPDLFARLDRDHDGVLRQTISTGLPHAPKGRRPR